MTKYDQVLVKFWPYWTKVDQNSNNRPNNPGMVQSFVFNLYLGHCVISSKMYKKAWKWNTGLQKRLMAVNITIKIATSQKLSLVGFSRKKERFSVIIRDIWPKT